MGKIQVGQKRPKTVDMGGFTIAPNGGATVGNKGGMTAEEKKALIDKIMEMPKDKIVPELRKHGFNEIADITEVQMKQETLAEEEKKAADTRKKRLAEIKSLPEDEQLPLLLEEGFTDEAQELSEQLASKQESTEDGDGGEDQDQEEPANGTATELTEGTEGTKAAPEPEKKKSSKTTKAKSK